MFGFLWLSGLLPHVINIMAEIPALVCPKLRPLLSVSFRRTFGIFRKDFSSLYHRFLLAFKLDETFGRHSDDLEAACQTSQVSLGHSEQS